MINRLPESIKGKPEDTNRLPETLKGLPEMTQNKQGNGSGLQTKPAR
ncbi:MAG: hypothetical protein QM534_13940 [Sediminibacterium sp.]|nr:hypothetical protein [Sediminibacterium sp.]